VKKLHLIKVCYNWF